MHVEIVQEKKALLDAVESMDAELRELALKIHRNPEVSFHEYQAVNWLTEPLENAGFTIEKGIANLGTSFRATWEGEPGVQLLH
ncbi:hypothetical protein ABES02_22465 [Neobacillus pocheonensis]|uniref:hypothetical protein n=1 Tax=Neobacillus pocheonensis TaxID=363869 RepID=UPI003D26A650